MYKYALIIFFILISISSSAQKMQYGVEAGYVLSNIKTVDPWISESRDDNLKKNHNYISSYHINAYAGFRVKDWGISAEPGLIRKGTVTSITNKKFWLYYLQLPVTFNYYITDNFSISGGSEFTYFIKGTEQPKNGNSMDIEYFPDKFELAGLIGLNYYYGNAGIGFRYSHSISYYKINLFNIEDILRSASIRNYNNYFQLYFRYLISF